MSAQTNPYSPAVVQRDLLSGLVVFLVALPLCLGIALASNAPMVSGLIAGIVGGLLIGALSGSHTSVSGPAAGLAAVVVAQLEVLGSFPAFALAVMLGGVLQLVLGVLRAGFLASFFPSSVIKGLLAAIGILLILKQIPHVFGHDPDPLGEMGFVQPDGENTFTELIATLLDIHSGAALIGVLSLVLLVLWQRIPALKKSPVPAPLVVVILGLGLSEALAGAGPTLAVGASHLVQVPVIEGLSGLLDTLQFADFGHLGNPAVYTAALTIAVVASMETLLNLEAVDKIDPERRHSPPNRELFAQGAGNMVSGLLGGLPVTSVIVRSSVNISTGNRTRLSAIFHGILLAGTALLIPGVLNRIPLSCLAAILLVTGFKLASPALFRSMWKGGRTQLLPFVITIATIVLVDLLVGVVIGLVVSLAFILYSNFKRPLRKVLEHHLSEDVLRIQLANQVSFFSRAALERVLFEVPDGGHVLIDARDTDYLDPDVLELLNDYRTIEAPARKIDVSLIGFRDKYPELADELQFVDYTSRDLQANVSPDQVLELFKQGNKRFRNGQRIERDLMRQVEATAPKQAPFAVVLSCIDSRTPAELIFDLGIGDVFSVRVAGNVARDKILGSMEYGCKVAGAKMIAVVGHTSCGAVNAAVDLFQKEAKPSVATGCANIDTLVSEIQLAVDPGVLVPLDADAEARRVAADRVSRLNVLHTMARIRELSPTLSELLDGGVIRLVGGLYDVQSGEVVFFDEAGVEV